MGLRIDTLLDRKRMGAELTNEELRFFIDSLMNKRLTQAQVGAFCAFTTWRGMTQQEMVALTMAMAHSGQTIQWSVPPDSKIVDKHSTGGVGDKVSLILAPLWVTLGYKVPMVSAKGAGFTGGTLDKLESIYGMKTQLPVTDLQQNLCEVGCFIVGPNDSIAPADKLLYGIRSETATVSSIPLIVSSILSKKMAEGINHLVLDVKYGLGSHMKTRTEAYHLGIAIETVATEVGIDTRVVLSDMNQPLGYAVGNSLEVEEAIACLKGDGPDDLVDLVCELSGEPASKEILQSGAAFQTFERMVTAQGGDLSVPCSDQCQGTITVKAPRSGIISACDAYKIGYANLLLGGGRTKAEAVIHHGVGIRLHHKKDAVIKAGDVLAEVFVGSESEVEEAIDLIQSAYCIQ